MIRAFTQRLGALFLKRQAFSTLNAPISRPFSSTPFSTPSSKTLPSSSEMDAPPKVLIEKCGVDDDSDEDDEDDMEDMLVQTPFGNTEWGGPMRGGRYPEPTRHGDWHQKGRCTDFE